MELYLKVSKNIEGFFGDEAFVKLNYAFTAYLLLNPKEYEVYYKQLEIEACNLLPDEYRRIVQDIVRLCHQRNFIFRCLHGDMESEISIKLSSQAINALSESSYFQPGFQNDGSNVVSLKLDRLTAEGVVENLNSLNQVMQMYRGRYQMKPTKSDYSLDESEGLSEINQVSSSPVN